MATQKDELLQLIADIVHAQHPRHIGDEFATIARNGLPSHRCESCEGPMDTELDGYSRVCAECLGEDQHAELAAREPEEDPQTGLVDDYDPYEAIGESPFGLPGGGTSL